MKQAMTVFGTAATMSSVEIALLTGKTHADVMRDIRNMLDGLEKDVRSFAGIYLDKYDREQPCFKLPHDETICLLTGYDVKARMAVIQRWKELEAVPAKQRAPRIQSEHRAALSMIKPAIAAAKACGFTGNQAILSADKFVTGATGISPLAMMGATHLLADQRGMTLTPTELGRAHGMSAQAMNKYLFDQGLQAPSAAGTGWEPTPKASGHYEWLDTGKAYSAGTPIKQLKWFSSVAEFFPPVSA